ncbi:unnamed protein product [Pieris macdunnoughi]|uniref:Connectin n=1 Tax=Pieris macdunnoughi TaxID=345717 RepID=A0A821QTM8_9NEOP|nr:unnamed protein product [Pieris macdunnoughi]
MTSWKLFFLCAVLFCVEGKRLHQKRETKSHICDPVYNNTNKIQCYCVRDSNLDLIRSANCYATVNEISIDDANWKVFEELENVHKLTFTNTRGVILKYIPQHALQYTKSVLKLEVKYANIESIEPFDFANLTFVEDITLRDNQIKDLKANAFAHHRDLVTIGLDTNNIVEINRNVFVDLPSLEKLYLTRNKITTIHDKAFIHLSNLRELEIDTNNLFMLNSETFLGLKKLEKLDLSSNSLQVIGDNTFAPLKNLRVLNLDGNKIQMLDEKAFHGLVNLQSLSIAHNTLKEIKNIKLFVGLKSLKSMSLKGNQLQNLDSDVMAPILENFYSNVSSLDVEDNMFPCDCRLDLFLSLMNNTNSSHLKLSIENLKCIPTSDIRDKWTKTAEGDKNTDVEDDGQNDYEYYDDTQLNGKLFYIDMRFLLNCSKNFDSLLKPDVETPKQKTSVKPSTTTASVEPKVPMLIENKGEDQKNIYTTSRLSTVSAKPMANGFYDDRNMAADEAKPDKIKSHRSIQDFESQPSNSHMISSCVALFVGVFSVRLFILE